MRSNVIKGFADNFISGQKIKYGAVNWLDGLYVDTLMAPSDYEETMLGSIDGINFDIGSAINILSISAGTVSGDNITSFGNIYWPYNLSTSSYDHNLNSIYSSFLTDKLFIDVCEDNGIGNLLPHTINQLLTLNSPDNKHNTISASVWEYIHNFNQELSTQSYVTFDQLIVDGVGGYYQPTAPAFFNVMNGIVNILSGNFNTKFGIDVNGDINISDGDLYSANTINASFFSVMNDIVGGSILTANNNITATNGSISVGGNISTLEFAGDGDIKAPGVTGSIISKKNIIAARNVWAGTKVSAPNVHYQQVLRPNGISSIGVASLSAPVIPNNYYLILQGCYNYYEINASDADINILGIKYDDATYPFIDYPFSAGHQFTLVWNINDPGINIMEFFSNAANLYGQHQIGFELATGKSLWLIHNPNRGGHEQLRMALTFVLGNKNYESPEINWVARQMYS